MGRVSAGVGRWPGKAEDKSYLSYPEVFLSISRRCLEHLEPGICPVYRGTGRERMWYKAAGTAKGSQKVVLDVTSWEGEWRGGWDGVGGGQVGWLHPRSYRKCQVGVGRGALGDVRFRRLTCSWGPWARGEAAGWKDGEGPSGELRAGPAGGAGARGGRAEGSWSRRGFERL